MSDISIPQEIIDFMQQQNWGNHHLHWHVVRMWDRLSPAAQQWATQQGWRRYGVQEGEETNGLEFLAMHRVMIRTLVNKFPQHAILFEGWSSPPTDPNDTNDPLPGGATTPFNPDMQIAIDRLTTQLDGFDGEDLLGTFIETSLRPFPNTPLRRADDAASGIHNYLHGRFQDNNSPINMGDPSVNIENERFWRLHGWIDARWEAYRVVSGRSNNDPRYLKALAEAERHMAVPSPSGGIQPFAASPWHMDGHAHHDIHIPEDIKQSILDALYFCELE